MASAGVVADNMTQKSLFDTPFEFEVKSLAHVPAFRSFLNEYKTYSYAIAGAYVVIILAIQQLMKSREPFKLKGMLVLWNFVMAAFSTLGAVRTVPFFLDMITNKGLAHSCCDGSFFVDPVTNLWATLFVVSKVPELIDTVFIVVRKAPLTFLHVFHHASVVVFATHSYTFFPGSGLWFMTMNYAVHSIMYTYYALRIIGVRVPKSISMFITTSQIVQMIVACCVTAYVYFGRFKQGLSCGSDDYPNVYMASSLYFAYFLLFANFFIQAYVFNSKKTRSSTKKTE